MDKKHLYFSEHTFDKSYTQVNRSYKLTWNEKALLNHIITWQEATDDDGKPLVCFESNSELAKKLGIRFKTFEAMISEMNKYPFFDSTGHPGKGKSRNGGNLNRTTKVVDMNKLVVFLKAEQAEIEANGGVPVSKKKTPGKKASTVNDGPEVSVVESPLPTMPVSDAQEQPVQTEMRILIQGGAPAPPQCDSEQQEDQGEGHSTELSSAGRVEVICQVQEPAVPVLTTPLKSRATKSNVFYELTDLMMELDEALHKDVKQVQIDLQVAVMNHPNWSQLKKVVYSEWISDFMAEEYTELKEWLRNYKEESRSMEVSVASLEDVYLP